MAFSRKSTRALIASVSYSAAMLASFGSALAQSDALENIPSAIDIAKQIEGQSLVENNNNQNLISPRTISEAINQVVDVLSQSDEERFFEALSHFENLLKEKNSQDGVDILNIYTGFSKLNDFRKTGSNYEAKKNYLIEASKHKNWFVSFHTKRLLSVVHSVSTKSDLALKTAQEALELIPNQLSDEAINARISATELIAYLQNLKLNKELALINTQRLIDLKVEAGQTVDGIELINNLMYSLTAWRDNESRLVLAETLKRLEDKHGSTTPGLTNMHIARVYVDIGEYEKAISAAHESLTESKIDSLQQITKITLATAHAGLGDTDKAKTILASLPTESQGRFSIPYAETVIALKEGRVDDALKLMNERYDNRVRTFLQENTSKTAEMLAALGNSSERQAEREAALQREQALIQTRLEQQQNINKLLLALIALIGISGLAALLFARHRHRLAKQLAIKTEEAESADRMKTEFLGMVSHELRTPLNGIIGIADVLVSQGPTAEVRQRGNIILSSGNQLFSMIESIIDMSRIDGDKLELAPEPTSLKNLTGTLTEKWEPKALTKGLIFTSHISDDCPEYLDIDPKCTAQSIETLLSNAIKFTENGRVHMHVTVSLNESTHKADVNIIVADTGQGISEDVQAKLFKPFLQADSSMTRKYGGSGLRLAIARSIARMMNGDVTCNSREGRGSEFTLTFEAPLAEAPRHVEVQGRNESLDPLKTIISIPENESLETPAPAPQTPQIEDDDVFEMIERVIDNTANGQTRQDENLLQDKIDATTSFEGLTVLIVEDTPSNQDVIELLLEAEGIKCLSVNSGAEALAVLQKHRFDFVIMDIRMPDMDGVETTRKIRKSGKLWANVPIIALTADSSAENNAACMAAGMDIFLTKPVLSREMTDAIEFLRQQRQEADGQPILLLQDIA